MHCFLCGCPNAIPPVVTTGVGPGGQHVVHFQAIEDQPRSSIVAAPSLQLTNVPVNVLATLPATPAH